MWPTSRARATTRSSSAGCPRMEVGGTSSAARSTAISRRTRSTRRSPPGRAAVYRLGAQGAWEKLGGSDMNSSVIDGHGTPVDGTFNRIGGLGADAYGLWTSYSPQQVYVSHVVNGSWQVAGAGPVGPGGNG